MASKIDAALRKALDTQAGSTGNVLINEEVVREIERVVIEQTPLYRFLEKRPWGTNTYKYRKMSQLPASFFAADGAALNAADHSDYASQTAAMKYLYSRVEVTGPEQAAVDYMDLLNEQVSDAVSSIGRTIEQTAVYGSSTTNPLEFDGLVTQISTNNFDNGAVDTQMTLPLLNQIIDKPKRAPDTLVMPNALYRRLWSLAQASLRAVNQTEIDPGFVIPTYEGKPIFVVDQEIGANAAIAKTVVAFNSTKVRFMVQKPLFSTPLAKTKDSDDFLLGMYLLLAVIEEDFYAAKGTHLTA